MHLNGPPENSPNLICYDSKTLRCGNATPFRLMHPKNVVHSPPHTHTRTLVQEPRTIFSKMHFRKMHFPKSTSALVNPARRLPRSRGLRRVRRGRLWGSHRNAVGGRNSSVDPAAEGRERAKQAERYLCPWVR